MSSLFPEPVEAGWECRDCGWFGYVTEAERKAHRCDRFDLDRAISTFLKRWTSMTEHHAEGRESQVLRGDKTVIEAELRALIQDAKEHAQ